MLQFSISVDEKTQQMNWVGNMSPAQAISFIAQYIEQTLANVSKELQEMKKGVSDGRESDTSKKPT